MKITHKFQLTTRCPVNQLTDNYTVTLKTKVFVKVEDILAKLQEFSGKSIFQEELTRQLSDALWDLAMPNSITTHGYHSGVETTVTWKYKAIK